MNQSKINLKPRQITFLANYLASAHTIALEVSPEDFADDAEPLTPEQIHTDLTNIITNGDREGLYEYLEDFSFINDPLFDLFITTLI